MGRWCNSRFRDFLFGFFERWDHLPSLWSIFRCIRARAPSIRNRSTTAAQHLSSNHLLTFMMPLRFLLCGGQRRSAVRNDQVPVRICMESESPARGKTAEVLQEIELCAGKCLRDTTQRVGSPRLDHVAVLSIETKTYSAVLCSGLEISSP